MAEEEKDEGSKEGGAKGGGGGPSKLVLILTAVNLVVTLGVIGVLLMTFQKEQSQPSIDDVTMDDPSAEGEGGSANAEIDAENLAEEYGQILTLEQFTVNLATVGSVNPKFARVNISLQIPNTDTESEITRKMPQVRNAIIDLFNSKRPNDLATPDGRNYLKEEIENALNSFLVTGKVKGVFFTNFALSS